MLKAKFLIVYLLLITIFSCKKENEGFSGSEEEQIEAFIKSKKIVVTEKTSSGLRYVRNTDGPAINSLVKKGQTINVNYSGKLLNDEKFDSGNFSFVLGAGRVVGGFDEGISKMKVGEKATIIFPSSLGYGSQGAGNDIPPNAPLVFDIEVVSAK
jgi:FKBP-type peptidyl-prolyl cis-trans isomerase